jgi:hypothetical protein
VGNAGLFEEPGYRAGKRITPPIRAVTRTKEAGSKDSMRIILATLTLSAERPSVTWDCWPLPEPRTTFEARPGRSRVTDLLSRLQAALSGRYTIERELGRGGMATFISPRT